MSANRSGPKLTPYAGIMFRSRLEALAAATLDNAGVPWVYEPYRFFGRTATHQPGVGSYLPDFEVGLPGCPPWYVEVKPTSIMQLSVIRGQVLRQAGLPLTEALRSMHIISFTYPNARLALWLPEQQRALVWLPHSEQWSWRNERLLMPPVPVATQVALNRDGAMAA